MHAYQDRMWYIFLGKGVHSCDRTYSTEYIVTRIDSALESVW